MAKTIDELKSKAAVVRDATEEKENTATRVGQLLIDMIDTLSESVSVNAIKGYVAISCTDELPENPSASEQMIGYLLDTTLYVYVGEGGDTLDGKYQSAELKGAQGPKGDSGVHLGDVVLVNDLTQGGATAALSAEMGKVLNAKIEGKELSSSSHKDNFTITSANKYSNASGAIAFFFNVIPQRRYCIKTGGKTAIVAILKNYDNASSGNTPNFSEYYGHRFMIEPNSTFDFVCPDDANAVYMYDNLSSSTFGIGQLIEDGISQSIENISTQLLQLDYMRRDISQWAVSPNLFNPDTAISGKGVLKGTGELSNSPYYYASDYIAIPSGAASVYMSPNTVGSIFGWACYNSNKVFTHGGSTRNIAFESGDAYFRFSVENARINTMMIVVGSSDTDLPSEYKPYSTEYKLKDSAVGTNSVKDNAVTEAKLSGETNFKLNRADGYNISDTRTFASATQLRYNFGEKLLIKDGQTYYVTLTTANAAFSRFAIFTGDAWASGTNKHDNLVKDTKYKFTADGDITYLMGYFINGSTLGDVTIKIETDPIATAVANEILPISIDETDFIYMYNLYNKDTGVDYVSDATTVATEDNIWKCYLTINRLYPSDDYFVTAFLPIKGNKFYADDIGSTYYPRFVGYYDENKTYISSVDNGTNRASIFTPPSNAYYVRITYFMAAKSALMVTHDLNPTTFIPYGRYVIDNLYVKNDDKVPEAVFPSRIYTLIGEQNSIYHNEYINCYNPYAYYLQKDSTMKWNFHERCWRRESDATDGTSLKFSLRNKLTRELIQSVDVPMLTASKEDGNTSIKVACIGDSFCYGGYYVNQIATVCPDATMVGMRELTYGEMGEGRGGWSLRLYMNPKSSSINLTSMESFSPFMHASGYNYYGVMEFWASIVNGTSQYAYGTNGFGNYSSWFDTNGRKANPVQNDLVYNQTAQKYEYYNGSEWVQLATDPTFEFNYEEYLRIWQIDTPDFVILQFGTNDFSGAGDDFFNDTWKSRMDTIIDSINACAASKNKTIKIIICTVLTCAGLPNSNSADNIVGKSRTYWEMRKLTIQAFDNDTYRTKNVYIADTGTSVDDKYGFNIQYKKPFEYYTGDERDHYDNNSVHPSVAGYKQFGTCIAGAIQYLRD